MMGGGGKRKQDRKPTPDTVFWTFAKIENADDPIRRNDAIEN